jgi:hypothetical protein
MHLLHHHQIGCGGQTFRANGQDTAAVCSTINPACAAIHFVFLQVPIFINHFCCLFIFTFWFFETYVVMQKATKYKKPNLDFPVSKLVRFVT